MTVVGLGLLALALFGFASDVLMRPPGPDEGPTHWPPWDQNGGSKPLIPGAPCLDSSTAQAIDSSEQSS